MPCRLKETKTSQSGRSVHKVLPILPAITRYNRKTCQLPGSYTSNYCRTNARSLGMEFGIPSGHNAIDGPLELDVPARLCGVYLDYPKFRAKSQGKRIFV